MKCAIVHCNVPRLPLLCVHEIDKENEVGEGEPGG